MNSSRHLSLQRLATALALFALTLFVSSAGAAPKGAARTAQRGGIQAAGSFTFSTPLELTRPASPVFFQQGGEPEVKTDIWGNIYATAIQGVPGGVDLWKSINGGSSFVYMGEPDGAQDHCPTIPQCAGLGGGDDQIDVSPGGFLYISSLWAGSVTMSTSTDGGTGGVLPGQAWKVNPLAAGPGAPIDDRQWVAAYGTQTINMTYADASLINPPGVVGLFFTKSTDGGQTFSAPTEITPLMPFNSVDVEGNLVADQYNGNLYTAWVPNPGANIIKLSSSTDGGSTWTTTTAYTGPAGSDNRGVFPILALDRGGNLHLVFTNCTSTRACHVFLTSSANPGAATPTWTSAVQVDEGLGAAVEPWVVAGSPGHVDITWLGSAAASPDVASNWNVYFAQTTDALSGTPTFSQNQAEAAVMHDHSICFNGGGCTANPSGEPQNRDLLEYYTMTLDPDGNANIVYADSVNDCDPSVCISNAWFMKQTGGPSAYAPPAAPAPATFATNLTLTGSSGAAEPSIAVDSHNCIYGSAPGTYFWASEDNGSTFRDTTLPPVLGGGDEDVTTIPKQDGTRDDALYYADLALADVGIFKSTDRGNTWSGNATPYANLDPSSDRQWISGDRINGGANQVLYELDHELASEVIRLSASADDSAWTTTAGNTDPELTTTIPNTNPGPVFVSKPTHKVYGVFLASTTTTNAGDPPFGKEPNLWEVDAPAATPSVSPAPPVFGPATNHPVFRGVIDSPTTAPAGTTTYGSHLAAIFPAADADSGGNIYAVWTTLSARPNATIGGSAATTWDIWFAASHDGGQNFYGPFKVSSGIGTSIFPWIAAGDAGKVDIVWYQSSNPTPPLVSDPSSPGQLTGGPNSMPAGSTWTVMFAQSLNAASREPVFTVVQAGDHKNHNGNISIGGLTGSSDRSLLDYFEIAVGPDGKANILYADNGLAGLHVSYARQNGGPLARNPAGADLGCATTTAVTVASFHASAARHVVRVVWNTGSELQTAGFNVWRRNGAAGYTRLNARLIAPKGLVGGGLGGRYEYLDRRVRAGRTYSYRLELVGLDGTSRWAGPVSAKTTR